MANEKLAKFTNNIEDIIQELTDDEVISLSSTITGGLLKNKISCRQDALKVILNYSDDIPSLLRRKVFTREKLLSYLYDKNVPIRLPITKPEIIEKILHLWTNETDDIGRRYSSTEPKVDASIYCSHTELNEDHQFIQINSNEENTLTIEESNQNEDKNIQTTVMLLAEQFSDWFYKLLNGNELTPEHFFPDGILNLFLVLNGDANTKNICNDPQAITDTLISIKNQYNLIFNPNLMRDGLKSQMDCHGLVMVLVGGTLHINSVCVGVFEQMFALARDPLADNNWKIKRTDLRLTNGSISSELSSLSFTENESSDLQCT